jgi:hypothetical protein
MKKPYARLAVASLFFCCIALYMLTVIGSSDAQTLSTISGRFYKFEILATSASLGFTLRPETSINSKGIVGFAADQRLYSADGLNPVRTLANQTGASTYSGGLQVNENDQLLGWVFSSTSGSTRLVRYDTNQLVNPFNRR